MGQRPDRRPELHRRTGRLARDSGGWETSRLDLSDFAGKQLKFRWTEHGKDFADLIPANWGLGNATIYTCSK